jgi:hypothetical protein
MANDLFGVVALLVVLGIGGVALGPAAVSGGELVQVDGEPVSVSYGSPTPVDESGQRFADRVTVRNATGDELDRRTDFRWNSTTGEITFLNTNSTTAGNTATVDYQYRQQTALVAGIAEIINTLGVVIAWGLLILASGYVIREVV